MTHSHYFQINTTHLKDVEPFVPEEFGSRNRNTLYTRRSPDDTEKPRLHNEQIKHETYRYRSRSKERSPDYTKYDSKSGSETSHKITRSRSRNQSRSPVKHHTATSLPRYMEVKSIYIQQDGTPNKHHIHRKSTDSTAYGSPEGGIYTRCKCQFVSRTL